MKKIIILFGPPGSGKGTQAKELASKTGYHHVCTGDLLRDLKTKTDLSTDEQDALVYMERGELVPSFLIYKLAFAEITKGMNGSSGVILDGAIRSVEQVQKYTEFFKENDWLDEVVAVVIDLSDEDALERLTKRSICPKCGAIYIKQAEHEKCAKCGAELVVRSDDTTEAVKARLLIQGNTALEPILAFYKDLGVLSHVDGSGTVEEVKKALWEVLNT